MQNQPVPTQENNSELVLISKLFTRPKHAEYIKNATELLHEKIHLYHNQLPNIISAIKHIHFPELTFLHLSYNNISTLQQLPHLDCPMLKTLHISFNNITQSKPLRKCFFPNLEKLSIMSNKIYDFDSLNELNFPNLTAILLEDVKNLKDSRAENPALFAKFFPRRTATFTTVSKSLPHVRTMVKG